MSSREDMLVKAKAIMEKVEESKETIDASDAVYDLREHMRCKNCKYIVERNLLELSTCSHPFVITASFLTPKGHERYEITRCSNQRSAHSVYSLDRDIGDSQLCGSEGLLFEDRPTGITTTPSLLKRIFKCMAHGIGMPT